jgi:methyl-accepting chemotaxis protein
MRTLSIKAKIWLSISIFAAGYVALLILLQWTTSQTQAHMKVASDSLFPAAISTQQAEAGFQKVTKRYSDAVLMQDKSALASAEDDAKAVVSALQAVKDKTTFNPALQQEVSSLIDRFADIQGRSKTLYTAMIEHPESISAQTQQSIAALAKDNKQFDASLQSLQDEVSKAFAAELNTVTVWSNRQRSFGMIVLLIALVCGGGISAFVINRQIAEPLRQLADSLKDISEGEGDLTRRLEFDSGDELGVVGKSFDTFMEKLHGIMSQIAANTHQLASASEEISTSAALMAERADTQQNQTTQISTAMQEMSSTVLQVSENSNKATEASRQAAETAREGGGIVEETLTQMRAIAESVEGTAKKMEELGKSSDQIGRIAGVIDDIADQTNLLALNAAIEAARAGEQGRGFAVVADEVRKLAERTTTATKEIAQMITNIQNETKTAVTAMEAGTKQVENGVKSTARAGDSLKQIIEMAERVGDMITHIATAATEQSSATEEINQNLEQIAKLVKESAVGAQQAAKACQDLSELALDLQNMVGNFNLRENGKAGGRSEVYKSRGFGSQPPGVPKSEEYSEKALAAVAH